MKAMEADPSDQEKSAACAAAHKKYKAMVHALRKLDTPSTKDVIRRALVSDDADRVELAKKVQAQAARCFKLMKAMEADPSDQEKSAACAAAHKKYKAMAQKLATLDKSAGHVMNPEAVALSALGQAKGGSLSGEVAQIATGTFVLEDKKTVKVEGQDDETKRAVYQVSAGVIDSAKVSAAQKQGVVTGVAKIEDTQSDATATQGMGASQTHLSMSRARAVMVNGQAVKNADFEKLSTEEALQQALTQAVKQSKVKSTVVDAQGDKSERLVDDPQVKGAFVAQAFRAKQVFEAAKQSDSRAPTAEAAAQKAKREAANRAKFQKMLKKALLKSVQEHLVAKGAHDDVEVADDWCGSCAFLLDVHGDVIPFVVCEPIGMHLIMTHQLKIDLHE